MYKTEHMVTHYVIMASIPEADMLWLILGL